MNNKAPGDLGRRRAVLQLGPEATATKYDVRKVIYPNPPPPPALGTLRFISWVSLCRFVRYVPLPTFSLPSAATHPTFVDDEEGMSPLSVLHIHTATYPNEREQGLGVTLEELRMRRDDAVVDGMPQSQNQPRLTTPG